MLHSNSLSGSQTFEPLKRIVFALLRAWDAKKDCVP